MFLAVPTQFTAHSAVHVRPFLVPIRYPMPKAALSLPVRGRCRWLGRPLGCCARTLSNPLVHCLPLNLRPTLRRLWCCARIRTIFTLSPRCL